MLLHGLWELCPDGITRPIIKGEVEAADGSWAKAPMLVDTAADRTVLSADLLAALGLPTIVPSTQLAGVGGQAPSVLVATRIRLLHGAGRATFMGQFAAVTDLAALDMSVLGRDILNLFAVIVDRPGGLVCLVGQGHQYVIQ
jgi:aspartyl protease